MQISVSSLLPSGGAASSSGAISSNVGNQGDNATPFGQLLNQGQGSTMNEANTASQPLLNMMAMTPEQQAALEAQLQALQEALESAQDPSSALAQWVAAQPNPDLAYQQLGLLAEQGMLPAELNQVMAQLYAQLPMNQRMSLTGLQRDGQAISGAEGALNHTVTETKSGLVHVAQSQSVPLPQHAGLTPQQTQALNQTISIPESMLSTLNNNLSLNNMMQNVMNGANASASTQGATTDANLAPQQWQAKVDVTEPEWGRELVDQLRARMQVSQSDHLQKAHVRLDPPELGRLEVTVRVEGDKASIHFTAAHPQLREALALNAERLRMDFDQSNLQLVDVSVSSGMSDQENNSSQSDQHDEQIAENTITATGQPSLAFALGSKFESMV